MPIINRTQRTASSDQRPSIPHSKIILVRQVINEKSTRLKMFFLARRAASHYCIDFIVSIG